MTLAVFSRHYRALNTAQREAVDTIEGPVMVVAGPGTGKTAVLTLRIANILRLTDTPANAILALAFTNSAAHSMRERLAGLIGSSAYRVNIHTFHSFCNEVIKRYPEEFPRIVGSTNISKVEQIKLMEEVINKARVKILKPFGEPFYHLYNALSEIEKLKKENISPEKFKELVAERERVFRRIPDKLHKKGVHRGKMKSQFAKLEKDIAKYKELVLLYRAYEAALRHNRFYDFSDMVMEVVRVLEEKPDFLLELQEEFLYLLADEHQDANLAQNQLLSLLASFHPSPNLFVVGDEKQAIFQFQGASLENFFYFKKLYPEAHLISLTQNYRSSQTILDAAHSLISQSRLVPVEARVRLRASAKVVGGRPVLIYPFGTTEAELDFVAEALRQKIASGVNPDEIAVLYRDNQDGQNLSLVLTGAQIPHVIESESNILNDPTIKKLILLLRTIHFLGDDAWLAQVMQLDFLNLPSLDVYRLVETARIKKASIYDLISNKKKLRAIGLTQPKSFEQLFELLLHWHRLAQNEPLVFVFGRILEESGILASIFSRPEAASINARLAAFYNEIKNLTIHRPDYRLVDFLDYLETLERHGLVLREGIDPAREGVRLMTVHRAKGLEFDYVYVINAEDGHFGGRRHGRVFRLPVRNASLEIEDPIDSERRLFYVALTRARKEVVITYAKEDKERRVRLPSQFISEIRDEFKEVKEAVGQKAKQRSKKFIGLVGVKHRREPRLAVTGYGEKAYLRNLFLLRGLSVTDLNNYLECPLKYFFLNLLRLTRVQTRSQFYGTAVHGALKDFFDRYQKHRAATKNYLLSRFAYHLDRQPLASADLKDSLERGRRALAGYFDWYRNAWPREIMNEFFIRGVKLTPEIKIKGRIDKIEFLGLGREVRVVDYKTSKPKGRRVVSGETKSSSGSLKRQLVFYKLLLEGLPKKEYEVVSGEIDFVEPDDRGRFKKEEIEISRADVDGLTDLVQKTAGEILSLKFLKHGCGNTRCRWCELFEMSRG